MLRTRFRVNLHSIVAWMSRNPLLETGTIAEELAKVDEAPVSSKKFIQATIEWKFTVKHVRDIMKTVKCTVQKSTHNTAQSVRPLWLNCWVFVCKLSGCGFKSHYSHQQWSFFCEIAVSYFCKKLHRSCSIGF